jgi:hypothetical protein
MGGRCRLADKYAIIVNTVKQQRQSIAQKQQLNGVAHRLANGLFKYN